MQTITPLRPLALTWAPELHTYSIRQPIPMPIFGIGIGWR